MENTQKQKVGVYLGGPALVGVSFFLLVMAFAIGFLAQSYIRSTQLNQDASVKPQTAKVRSPQEIYSLLPAVSDSDHLKGDKNAKVVLVEYSDFQCPYCATFNTTVRSFLEKYPEVAFVFRHLPLSFHEFAMDRARGAECLVKFKGNTAFWDYTDTIYASAESEKLNKIDLALVASGLAVDPTQFDSCVKSSEFDQKINDTSLAGQKFLSAINPTGGYGTPGVVIINREKKIGERLAGAVPLAELEKAYAKVK